MPAEQGMCCRSKQDRALKLGHSIGRAVALLCLYEAQKSKLLEVQHGMK